MNRSGDRASIGDPFAFIARGGEMGDRTRSFDWSQTPLGPVEGWPQSLKTVVRVMLDSRYAMWLGWGPDLTFFYNDAYARMTLGPKHPWALGRPAREVWSEIWADIRPRAESVLRTGRATWDEGLLLFLERRGFPEETYHTFSYSPVPDDQGEIGGMLCVVTEDTERTIGERRLRTLRELAARTTDEAKSVEEACQTAASILVGNPHDVPFALLYLLDSDGRRARLAGLAGVDRETPTSPATVDLNARDGPWPFRRVVETGAGLVIQGLPEWFGLLPGGAWPESPQQAVVLPMAKPGQARLAGFIVAGVSPRLPFDDGYRGFLDLVAGQVAIAVTNARAYEEERRRAETLAELDRTKTAFFSNVSHEFRTPLTLMLGPVEDFLARPTEEVPPRDRELLEVVNRNGQRLLRLVNTLLDFSRIEAGRVQASYVPTDLAALTADLASVFRSACDRAGLGLTVDCAPLVEPVFVDRAMWEKIVLNLVSNAFKYTFEGEIAVRLRQVGQSAQLRVRDTGTGIPAEEMPRLFERFHRIENARGRTHEGSGIGLALVQELVRLHGGSVAAESRVGEGTTFTVTVPLGMAHLPPDRVGTGRPLISIAADASPYVGEALRWLPPEGTHEGASLSVPATESATGSEFDLPADQDESDPRPRVLIADDNADMRRYVTQLLAGTYRTEAVPDGESALAAVRRRPPDLILSDVMMPRLDGFGLLRALRADPRTREVPVLLLSARAGEEARVEGLEAGADDYITKPFHARELLARVASQLDLVRLRRQAEQERRRGEERSRAILESITDAFFAVDRSWRFTYVNRQAERLLNRRPGDLLNKVLWDEFPGLAGSEFERVYRQSLAEGIATSVTAFYPDHDRWYEVHNYPAPDGLSIYFQDVTQRVQAAERERWLLAEAATANAQFRAFFEQGALFAGIMAIDGTLLEPNRLSLEACGYSKDQVVGRRFWDCPWWSPSPDLAEQIQEASAQAAAGETFRAELPYFVADGSERIVDLIILPIKDEAGRVLFLAPTGTDITDRKRAEAERERYFAVGADLLVVVGFDGRFQQVNPACERTLGWTPAELLSRPWLEFLHPDDQEATLDLDRQVRQGRQVLFFENRYRHKDGSYRWLSWKAQPFLGQGVIYAGATDITERKLAEEALRLSEQRWRTLTEALPNLVWSCLPNGQCDWLSSQWGTYTGIPEPELLGMSWLGMVIHPDDRERTLACWKAACEDQGDYDLEYRIRRHDGEYHWFKTRGVPIRNERGQIVYWFGTCTDIEDVKRLEEALRDADRRKDEFLATLAHELRNPLAPIRNGLQILRIASGAPRPSGEALTLMERQVAHLVRLIDDLMDVSRITRGKLDLRKERVELATVIQTAVETSRPLMDASGHELVVSLAAQPILILVDPTRLAQVFSNLLNNAAKYTEPGGHITLVAGRRDHEVIVTVRDNGVGIPPEMLPRIFDMFTQVDRAQDRSQSGLGIGLTLVRRLIEMHGGSIEARSAGPGLGSEFLVRLPVVVIAKPQPPTPVADARPASPGLPRPRTTRRILVVDDNHDSARTLARLLKLLGHETHTAHDGGSALVEAESYRPEVILLDIGLPVMSGYDVAREIRTRSWGQDVAIVALTGWGQEGDRRKSREAGIDHHLVKPIDPAILEALLSEVRPGPDAAPIHEGC